MLRISDWVQDWWFMLLMLFFAAGYIFSQAKRRSKRFADWIDSVALKIPIIGSIVHDAVMAITASCTMLPMIGILSATESIQSAKRFDRRLA